MTSLLKKQLLFLLLIVQLMLPTLIQASEKITIGILAFRPKPIVEAKWQPLINYLNSSIRDVEFHMQALNYTELEAAVERKSIDFVFTNSSHFVQLAHQTNLSSPLATLINKKSGQTVRSFAGTILVKNSDSHLQSLKDLAGKIIATPSTKSFGGYKMQAYELYNAGVDLGSIKVVQTTMPHDKAVISLIKGDADAAFVRSGILESLEKSGKVKVGQLRVLNLQTESSFPFLISTRLYPEWPISAMPHVGENLAGQVTAALLALPHNGAITQEINIHGFRIPADYEPIREVLRALRLYPYDQSPIVTLEDLWAQHRTQIITGFIALTIIISLTTLLFVYNRRLHDNQKKLEQNNESLRIAAVAFDTREGILITDQDEKIVKVNHAFELITGYPAKEALGNTPRLFNSGRHPQEFYQQLWQELQNSGYWQGEIWNRRKNGEIFPVGQTITAIKNDAGDITHYLSTFDDITSFKESEERIKKLAFYDPLTGLANRRLLQDHLKQARAHSIRNKTPFALFFLDLDHFKTLNDTLGHAYGDQLLQQVAERLKESVREVDTIARTGGDEFVILLEELSTQTHEASKQAKRIADKVLRQITIPYSLKGSEHAISASIGISLYTNHNESIDDMMVRSDLAMYEAKAAGRNAIRFFDPSMQETIQNRSQIEDDLRLAIRKEQFELYYQPKLNIEEEILGYEALLRWHHPEQGLLKPESFIDVAEESGLIVEIGLWVLKQVCLQLQLWEQFEETKHLSIAINISEVQLHRDNFVESVIHVIDGCHCKANRLQMEITESMLMKEIDTAIIKINQLRDLGISFAIDDFGTGFSSLNYLKKLPVDWLKIDQSFIQYMLQDSKDAAIVKTILSLPDSLELQAIAEGVETEEQRQHLLELGCPVLQGYLFAKPKPIDQLNHKPKQREQQTQEDKA